ncbi:MAG: Clp protease N-terminal domain-containing protein, partial [Acidimicrobiales bacterium]
RAHSRSRTGAGASAPAGWEEVSSLDLLRGLLDDGENFAVRLLLAQGVDVEALGGATAPSEVDGPGPVLSEPNDTLLARLTMPARLASASAFEAVVELGHNYVGCEHLIVGLTATQGRDRDVLAAHGVEAKALRQAILAGTAGVALERTRAADQNTAALADLTRRLEAIKRQLAGAAGA